LVSDKIKKIERILNQLSSKKLKLNQMKKSIATSSFISLYILGIIACSKDASTTTTGGGGISTTVADVYKKVYGASSIYYEGDYVVFKSTGIPDHKSPYFMTSSSQYIKDTRSSFQQAPNSTISSWTWTFKIPKTPKEQATKQTLTAATIGIALNGVPFFNQYQATNQAITVGTGEYVSFDLYGGHPTPNNEYHYHIEPNYLTTNKGSDALVGFMLDGYPIYGPKENGKTLTSADLDAYHGHTSATADYPSGTYHYHITSDAPYINGNGYFGVPGTWSK
jgi:hypothetical protein